jgi:hypothetical protein
VIPLTEEPLRQRLGSSLAGFAETPTFEFPANRQTSKTCKGATQRTGNMWMLVRYRTDVRALSVIIHAFSGQTLLGKEVALPSPKRPVLVRLFCWIVGGTLLAAGVSWIVLMLSVLVLMKLHWVSIWDLGLTYWCFEALMTFPIAIASSSFGWFIIRWSYSRGSA